MSYLEQEVKILNINVEALILKLEQLGAHKVMEHDRIFTTFDAVDIQKSYLKQGILIRLTEEDQLKLSISKKNNGSSLGEKETVKVFVSRKQEMIDFFGFMGIVPISVVKSHRISYEWETEKGIVDFDIDSFPEIPPFLEIDVENLTMDLDVLLEKLDLSNHKIFDSGTEEVYRSYGIDYFEKFSTTK